MLIDGVVHSLLKGVNREDSAIPVLVISIGLSFWVQYARTIRGSTLVEKNKDYIAAARLVGIPTPVNKAYYETLTKLAQGRLPLNTYRKDPKKLREEIRSIEN